MDENGTYPVHLTLRGNSIIDTSGKYSGPLPATNAVIDVLSRSRRIYPARVTHVDRGARFPIWATEIEL